MTIVMRQEMVPDSRSAVKGSAWRVWCDIDGIRFAATSRSGVPFSLAR